MVFKIGDRVKYVGTEIEPGVAGYITDIYEDGYGIYKVRFAGWNEGHDDDRVDCINDTWWCEGEELELDEGIPAARNMLPSDSQGRKNIPLASGVLDYFTSALIEVAKVSKAGNDQHNPGEPLHWAQEKSTDHADTLLRHFIERGTVDTDGTRHSAKLAWRALALLQMEMQAEGYPKARGAK